MPVVNLAGVTRAGCSTQFRTGSNGSQLTNMTEHPYGWNSRTDSLPGMALVFITWGSILLPYVFEKGYGRENE